MYRTKQRKLANGAILTITRHDVEYYTENLTLKHRTVTPIYHATIWLGLGTIVEGSSKSPITALRRVIRKTDARYPEWRKS